MLNSDLRRKTHMNFQYDFFVRNVFFSSALTSNRRHFHVKLKSILNQIFNLSVSIDVFNHFKAAYIKIRLF